MEVVDKKITELIQAEYNPRKLSDKQFRELRDSLNRFGFVDPVLVNVNKERKNIIIGGHQRTKVWESMGNETVPVVELDLTLDQEKELNVRLNKSGGEFDFELLQEHFNTDSLVEWGFEDEELIKTEDVGGELEKEIPEVEFSEFLNETNNYVVLFFDNEMDWLQAQTHFDLKTVSSKRQNGKEWSKGVGRVIQGSKYLNRINKDD